MARHKPRSADTIYNYARGDGWILTALDGYKTITNGHEYNLVLYYTDEPMVETHTVRNTTHHHGVDSFLSQYLDIGGTLGAYAGEKPAANVAFDGQPTLVQAQQHATDIYSALGNARGLSETMAVRAAEQFGDEWDQKTADDWKAHVKQCGAGTASNIEREAKRHGILHE